MSDPGLPDSSILGPNNPDPDIPDPLYLAEYAPGETAILSDAERWPTIDSAGTKRLNYWRAHPDAPTWTHATGDRLTAAQAERVRAPLSTENWIHEHLGEARKTLRYRGMPPSATLADYPTVSRADLVEDLAAFVPLDADMDRMLHGTSSGSTGAALIIPDDVEELARGFHLLLALAGNGVKPASERLAVANLVCQRQAFTYVSLISSFEQRAMARINLHPTAWPSPEARDRFMVEADPQIISGHPASLAELVDSGITLHPVAIFSGAMALSAPLRARIEAAFGCPVFDVYGLHETRPIAVRTDDGPFRVLDRRVLVEVLDNDGNAVPEGTLGEITVTAGENALLPLVRYRTGDFGRLVRLDNGAIGIADLEGRENTRFLAADGTMIPSVEFTQHLQAHAAEGWTVEQDATGAVRVVIAGGDAASATSALEALLGFPITLTRVSRVADLGEGKPRRYRSAVSP